MSSGWCCAPGSITTPFWNRGRSQQPTRTRRSFAWRSCVRSLWRLCSRSSKNTPTPKVCAVCVCLFVIYWIFMRVAVLVWKKRLIYKCGQRKRHVSVWRSWSHAPTTCLCRKFSEIIVSSFFLTPLLLMNSPSFKTALSHFLRTVIFYIESSLDCDRYVFSVLPLCVLFLFWCLTVFLFHIRYVIWSIAPCIMHSCCVPQISCNLGTFFTQRWSL